MSLVEIPSGQIEETTENVPQTLAEPEKPIISAASALGDTETLDLDYDEDEPDEKDAVDDEDGELSDKPAEAGDSTERKSVEKEEGENSSSDGEKEEGELEDGEISGSDEGEINSGPEDKVPIKKIDAKITTKNRRQNFFKNAPQPTRVESHHTNETSWERGLREARAAMRRANVVRQDPEFETRRLVAAPDGERIPGNYTDSDDCSRRSVTPPRRSAAIPSLLDLRMSPPRQFRHPPKGAKARVFCHHSTSPSRSSGRRRMRRTPSYSDHSRSSSHSRSYTPDVADLGPQVIYPNGRPIVNRRRERNPPKRRSRQSPPPPRRNSPLRRRTRTPPSPASSRSTSSKRTGIQTAVRRSSSPKKFQGLSPARDASPISSDSDMERYKSDEKVKRNKKPAATDSVNDPWARKPLSQIVAEKAGERLTKRTRSSSGSSRSSSCSSSSSEDGRKRKRSSSSSSRSSKSSGDEGSNRSPPRGDISGYRIPKKRKAAGEEKKRMTRQEIEDFFSKEKDMPKAFRKDKRRRSSNSSDGIDQNVKGNVKKICIASPSKHAQNISDSDSDKSSVSSKSGSSRKSCSPSGSRSRSVSPVLPARYRERSSEGTSKIKSTKSEVCSPISSPPPPPPEEKYTAPSPPPVESSNDVLPNAGNDRKRKKVPVLPSEAKQRRRRQLEEQLRQVEEELKKRRVTLQ